MAGNIIFFIVGAGIGGGLVAYHKQHVQAAVQREQREITRLRDRLHEELVRNAETRAYSKGFDAGVSCPMGDAERLVRTFKGRKAEIRAQKEA